MLRAEISGQKLVVTQPVHSETNPPPALTTRFRCLKKKKKRKASLEYRIV